MANFYIADTHFGHENIIRFDGRPFQNWEEMDRELIRRWNESVGKGDLVHIIGDFVWKPASRWGEIVPKLNGQKILIRGNHDPQGLTKEIKKYIAGFMDYKEFHDGAYRVVMSHYPMLFYAHDYDENTVMLCGHVHSTVENDLLERFVEYVRFVRDGEKLVDRALIYNVGCMMPWMDYRPRTLEEILEGYNKYIVRKTAERISKFKEDC